MNTLLALVLGLVALSGLVTVLIREPVRQAIALGIFGFLEALMFFAVQAPDVALSEIVVGAVALPAMLFLAIAKIRSHQDDRQAEERDQK